MLMKSPVMRLLRRTPMNGIRMMSTEVNDMIRSEISSTGLHKITINNPNKKNALSWPMFERIAQLLNESQSNAEIKASAITGTGEYFTSGVDLNNFAAIPNMDSEEQKQFAETNSTIIRNLFDAAINHDKPLFALANGPGVGLGVTIFGLCDMNICSDKSFFFAPFVTLNMVPEGCSSLTFPQIMGRIRAKQVLLFGERFDAKQAFEFGLVNKVLPRETFAQDSENCVNEYLKRLNCSSIVQCKKVVDDKNWKQLLLERNAYECHLLGQRFRSKEFKYGIGQMLSKK